MDERKMEIISQLMEELEGMMEPKEDDLCERLGKPKMKVEIESKSEEMPEEEGVGLAMFGAPEEEEGPEAEMKKRLLKMRGV